MSTYGILLPCDGSEPMPISVGDHIHINELVGGHFDAVSNNFDPQVFLDSGEPIAHQLIGANAEPFTAVGYVHDEGLILDLPVNIMASIVLQREIVGPCVLVSGTSPSGEYDGDNHDVPEWFANAVFQGGLLEMARLLHDEATIQANAFRLAYMDGVFTDVQAAKIVAMMESGDRRYDTVLAKSMAIALAYAIGRAEGTLPKFDRAEFEEFQKSLTLTDDAIIEFWNQEGV